MLTWFVGSAALTRLRGRKTVGSSLLPPWGGVDVCRTNPGLDAGAKMQFWRANWLVATIWAGLLLAFAWNLRGVTTAYQARDQSAYLLQALDEWRQQHLRLYQSALEAPSVVETLDQAQRKFLLIQEKYGSLRIEEPQEAAIVSVPETSYPERAVYVWRVYVPPKDAFCLTTSVPEQKTGESTEVGPSEISLADETFRWVLPPGESVIRVEWTNEIAWARAGSFESPPGSPDNQVRGLFSLTVTTGDHCWQLPDRVNIRRSPRLYRKQTMLKELQDSATLVDVFDLLGQGPGRDFSILLRRTKGGEGNTP